ncbi:MAG: M23 family metallopeptidase [Actinopolymorphaceae bacterium]
MAGAPQQRTYGTNRRRGVAVAVVLAVLLSGVAAFAWAVDRWFGVGVSLGPIPGLTVDDPGPRPRFALPFTCGQRWRLSTYRGHNPDESKIDMFRMDGTTRGAVVRASAAGEVRQLVRPGGVKIDHGGRWYTLYLHMDDISVGPGDEVTRGQPIGRVGAVGTQAAHLHYEQLFDANGDGNARTPEIVPPVVQGAARALSPDGPFPVVRSTNGC